MFPLQLQIIHLIFELKFPIAFIKIMVPILVSSLNCEHPMKLLKSE